MQQPSVSGPVDNVYGLLRCAHVSVELDALGDCAIQIQSRAMWIEARVSLTSVARHFIQRNGMTWSLQDVSHIWLDAEAYLSHPLVYSEPLSAFADTSSSGITRLTSNMGGHSISWYITRLKLGNWCKKIRR